MNRNGYQRCLVLLVCAALLFSGCQLAVPGAEAAEQRDRLIGVYITQNYINMLDMSTETDVNAEELVASLNGELSVIDEMQGRIYADISDGEITFPALKGLLMVNYLKQAGSEGYWTSEVSEGIQDLQNEYHSLDTGSRIRQSASIYLPYHVGEVCFYLNPVYQTEDQQIYLVPGSGSAMGTELGGELRVEISEETTLTVDGEENGYEAEFEIVINCVDIPEKIVLNQMDQHNQVLKRTEYLPEELPEEIVSEANTAYILVEEYTGDKILRSICQPDETQIAVFARGENSICIRKYAEVTWSK